MEKLKKDNINFLIVIIAFIFNIIVFAPIELFLTNRKEFWFSITDFLPITALFIFAFAMIGIIIYLIFRKRFLNIATNIIFSLFFGLYIQGNFLNVGYTASDGVILNWDNMILKGIINTTIWILILITPFVFRKLKKEKQFNLISSCIALLVIGMQLSTLGVLLINAKANQEKEMRKGLNNSNIFNFSKQENIVVLMADTFEATYMNQILEDKPEYKEKLKDFIYFDNCSTICFYTFSSMPIMLTGEEIELGKTLSENLEECFDKTNMYNVLRENGFSSELYVEKMLTAPNCGADNLNAELKKINTKFTTKTKVGKSLYKYVLYRYLPHFLKPSFNVTNYDFNKIKSEDESLLYKHSIYYLDDVKFNNALNDYGAEQTNEKKCFKLYQLNGMHRPYDTLQNIEYDTSEEYQNLPEEERRYNEGIASLNLLLNYVDHLKEAGVYDNTTIIFLADHGNENRFYPTLLIKKKGANQPFSINSAPVSNLEDLKPTILNIASNSKDYGKDYFDYEEQEERTRRVLEYTYRTRIGIEDGYKPVLKRTYETKGLASDKKSFKIVKEEKE